MDVLIPICLSLYNFYGAPMTIKARVVYVGKFYNGRFSTKNF